MGLVLGAKTARRMWAATQQVEGQSRTDPTGPRHERRVGVHAVYEILLTESIAAATFNAGTRKLTPVEFTAKILYEHDDADGTLTYHDTELEVNGTSRYLTAITVGAGKGRYAWLIDGRLLITDCTEFDLE